jgi:hypothetical protein
MTHFGHAKQGRFLMRLRQAALADEESKALDGALATIDTFLN